MTSALIDIAVLLFVIAVGWAGWSRGLGAAIYLGVAFAIVAIPAAIIGGRLFGERWTGITGMLAGIATVIIVAWRREEFGRPRYRRTPMPRSGFRRHRGTHDAPVDVGTLFAFDELPDLPLQRDRKRDRTDRALGAVLYTVAAVLLAWWAGATLSVSPLSQPLHQSIRATQTMRAAHALIPTSGTVARTLTVIGFLPGLPEPEIRLLTIDRQILADPEASSAARASVQITTRMCSATAWGSGWMLDATHVVTNAHLVAGVRQGDVRVRAVIAEPRPERRFVRYGTVVWFDAANDVAIVAMSEPMPDGVPTLTIARTVPEGEPVIAAAASFAPTGRELVPMRIDRTVPFVVLDLYGTHARQAPVTVFRGRSHEGMSGSALIDGSGHVTAMLEAGSLVQRHVGGFAVPAAVLRDAVARMRAGRDRAVSTEACTRDVR